MTCMIYVSVQLHFSVPPSIHFTRCLQLLNKPQSTSNSCLVPTQLTEVIRPHPSDNDVQPHTKPFCWWSQSDVCKWIIQYSGGKWNNHRRTNIEIVSVSGTMRGYRLCVCKCITYTTRAVTSIYPREWEGSFKPSGMHPQKPTQNNQGNLWEISCCGSCPNILTVFSTLEISSLIARLCKIVILISALKLLINTL